MFLSIPQLQFLSRVVLPLDHCLSPLNGLLTSVSPSFYPFSISAAGMWSSNDTPLFKFLQRLPIAHRIPIQILAITNKALHVLALPVSPAAPAGPSECNMEGCPPPQGFMCYSSLLVMVSSQPSSMISTFSGSQQKYLKYCFFQREVLYNHTSLPTQLSPILYTYKPIRIFTTRDYLLTVYVICQNIRSMRVLSFV